MAAYKATTAPRPAMVANPITLMRFNPLGRAPDTATSPKVDVQIDPDDVQNVQLRFNVDDDAVDGDGDGVDDDEKQSESVVMNEEDKKIYNEFRRTMSKDTVEVLGIKRIKDNVSRKIVYDALLKAKAEELEIDEIERVLFHGTAFRNVAKIVNNGFNRDFNRVHRYGKGTYFSSLASESAGYCEQDDEEDPAKNVMLVCRVIVGEYCVGTHDMDGSSVPYKADKKTQYESCVNKMKGPTIFVINRDYHAIPTHIITFKYKQ